MLDTLSLVQQESVSLQTEKKLSILELIQDGGLGGQVIIGLLFFLLLMVFYIYFERRFAIRVRLEIRCQLYASNTFLCSEW